MTGRVLIVDDARDMRFMLRLFLEAEGVEVHEAHSAERALDLLAGDERRYDAVVLDHRMPGTTGVELAQEMQERGRPEPVVLFSGYLHPALATEARAIGVPLIQKGDVQGLLAHLESLLCAA